MPQISLLDCTLRDGGFINDWRFGQEAATGIFNGLTKGGIDIIEVGFLNAACRDEGGRTMFADTADVQHLFGTQEQRGARVVGMIDYGTCPIERINRASESMLDGIRVIFKKARMHDALTFCRALRELGYLVFVQPVSITDYTPQELSTLLSLVGELMPHAVSIVDTYGLLTPEEVAAYFLHFDRALPAAVTIGYHAHNNLQLGFAGCRTLYATAAKHAPTRPLIFDATLLGMGKSAGNTPLELLALFCNEHTPNRYDLGELAATIEAYIAPLCGSPTWGYQLPFFLAAATGTHPSYVAHLQQERGLDAKKAFCMLQQIPAAKRLYFSNDVLNELCREAPVYESARRE